MRYDVANPINIPLFRLKRRDFHCENKWFNCKLSVNNQLVPNTILDKKVGQNYNFSYRTIVLLVKQRLLVLYKNISFGEAQLEIILQEIISILGIGVVPNKQQNEWAKIKIFNLGTHLPCLQNCERIENRNVLQVRVLRKVDIHSPCLQR